MRARGRAWSLGLGIVAAGCPEGGEGDGGGSVGTSTADSGSTAASTDSSTTQAMPDGSSGESSSSSGGGLDFPPGEFDLLTYNVAGLPQGISSSNPEQNIPQISPLLDAFDLVLVQEDFWYHEQLSAEVTLPYASMPWSEMPTLEDIGDGLNRFGIHPFVDHERVAWYDCHGTVDCASDCLATKGWSFARTTLAEGVEVDVYNLHMEAGGCPEDIEIRTNAAQDLVDAIAERSSGRAVIVGGDFNLSAEDPEDVEPLGIILEGAGLSDACDAVSCGDQRIDHVMVRDGGGVALRVQQWWIPEPFVDARSGEPLSDHLPVAVTLRFEPE
ncbi:MAG: endonuclease/exonuclease/phosphatase family protein [Myxococcales bacterium]|nr:endonuclease/exonuclease/phosphatase family protein [Myxococcales bacterium]MCB9715351.1 endonuclease/exonuclease/phosphatase family protein [Myxococcales bacterium]